MINGRTFLTTLMLIGTVFFLFMFSGAAKGLWSDYDKNSFVTANEGGQAGREDEGGQGDTEDRSGQAGRVIYVGTSEEVLRTVGQWCVYQKRGLLQYAAPEEVTLLEESPPVFIVADVEAVRAETIEYFTAWVQSGVPVIVNASSRIAPDIKDERVAEFLGIRALAEDEIQLAGIQLYGGFLLGGEAIYEAESREEEQLQDLDLSAPWYLLRAGTKTYLSGILFPEEEEPAMAEYMADGKMAGKERPALLWRNSIYPGEVFVVNGPYLEGNEGMGFLAAMEYEMESYLLYPVINAQNLVIVNYPTFTSENEELMQELYSRNTHSVLRDLVWPGLASVMAETGSRITAMVRAEIGNAEGKEPEGEALVYFMKLLREAGAEAGISLWAEGEPDEETEAERTRSFLEEYLPGYTLAAAYIGDEAFEGDLYSEYPLLLKDYQEEEELLHVDESGRVLLHGVNTGTRHTYKEDLRMKSVETALGFASVIQNLEEVIYPKDMESQWQILAKKLSSNLSTYWRPYEAFDELTLSETAQRIRDFMKEKGSSSRQGDELTLYSETGKGYYILRLHGERIVTVSGAEWKEIEDGAYLLAIGGEEVRILLEKEEAPAIR